MYIIDVRVKKVDFFPAGGNEIYLLSLVLSYKADNAFFSKRIYAMCVEQHGVYTLFANVTLVIP